jgi:geranylgeranyl reductase family protein
VIHADVLIVGGGPAGSSCARRLASAGVDVAIVDAAEFPRDKLCGGWITPQVVSELNLDLVEYANGRTLQPITAFRTSMLGQPDVDTRYGRTVSYGIRRCEFDDYLLRRSRARLLLGTPVASIERSAAGFTINGALRGRLLVGAGGHFCPVARWMNPRNEPEPVVAAREVEFEMDARHEASCRVAGDVPELFFCPDLRGYGWCFRKGAYLNVGFGRLDRQQMPAQTREFLSMLQAQRIVPDDLPTTWRGHAYLLYDSAPRQIVSDGVLLIGDAAGMAYTQSGEGIRPAIESGLLAAEAIIAAKPRDAGGAVDHYAARLRQRFGARGRWNAASVIPRAAIPTLARALLANRWFTRRFVLNRWFLHQAIGPLTTPL